MGEESMLNPLVERATSDMLIGPDWAMNIEICDVCNRDPAQAKDIVKGIKKRLSSKNPKVQLLTLTLLETIIKNCGDIVHMQVAEKGLPNDMVKILKKKPDFCVKEKMLALIDTWQEAFGGIRAKYPQYFVAYQELLVYHAMIFFLVMLIFIFLILILHWELVPLCFRNFWIIYQRLGAVFPQRSENSVPVFTLEQTRPSTSYPQNNLESRPGAAESSAAAKVPTLSSTELQNARGIVDVLLEMLNGLDPGNKEGLKQDVIVDLVDQCHMYKKQVVHLVNLTSDESLLCEALALNDDLQRVLAKHDSIASGTAPIQPEKPKPDPAQAQVTADAPLINTGDTNSEQTDKGSTSASSEGTQFALPAPTTAKADHKIDLLSGDDYCSPTANSLALVPVGQPQPASPVASLQNALALVDMFSENYDNHNEPLNSGHAYPSSPQFQQQPILHQAQPSMYPNGSVSGPMPLPNEQPFNLQGSGSVWNGQIAPQQQQSTSTAYGAQSSNSIPPPPWEAELDESLPSLSQPQQYQLSQVVVSQTQPSPSHPYLPGSQTLGNEQVMVSYSGGSLTGIGNQAMPSNGIHPYPIQNPHSVVIYPQAMQFGQMSYMYPQQMYSNQMVGFSPGYAYGYGQFQQQNPEFLERSMAGLSLKADRNSPYSTATSSLAQSARPSKHEDKLFGDLVDISQFKPAKTTPGAA